MDSELEVTTFKQFKMLYVIGKGGFGRVWKVRDPKTNELFAMKEMSKKKYFLFFILFYHKSQNRQIKQSTICNE